MPSLPEDGAEARPVKAREAVREEEAVKVTAYRTALCASAVQRAPPASWWRRLQAWAGGLEDRLDLRRRRHAFHARYPSATWKQCQRAAELERQLSATGDFVHSVMAAVELEEFTEQMGPSRPPWSPFTHERRPASRRSSRRRPSSFDGCGQDSCACALRPGECWCICAACSENKASIIR